jgi:predicted enzyme related to lactoylglutathione lyase
MDDCRGKFLWYEYMTPDLDGAKSFYTAVAGWGTTEWKETGTPYTMWTVGSRAIGGVMPIPPGEKWPSQWMSYIGTPDVAKTTARAEALGATIYKEPTEIPKVGTFSVMADPQGVAFMAFTPTPPETEMPPPPPKPEVGDFSWHELITTDVDGALRFYSDLFGWTADGAMDMGPAGKYQLYKLGNTQLGGIYLKPKEMPGPPRWLYYIRVADLESAIGQVKAKGGQVLMGPHEVPGGDRIAVGLDPQGASFALVWLKALA